MTDDLATVRGETSEAAGVVTVTSSPALLAAVASSAPPPGKPVVPGYELLRVLGSGGMGVVWEAIEHRFERRVAVKVHKHAQPAPGDDLWTEALVAAKIADPGIVRVLDVGYTLDEHPFYAMEIAEGTELSALIADGPVPPHKAVAIAADIARAASAAHEHGVVHRDLKPKNVIVDATGRARVLDFGIAVHVQTQQAGVLAGSPPYMAPEQALLQPVGPRTDVYAIGVILYEMLTGRKPFAASTVPELLASIVQDDAPPPSRVTPAVHGDLDAIVGRCLAKSPEQRFATARALFETLSSVLEGRPVPGTPPSTCAAKRLPTGSPPDRPRREDATKRLSWSFSFRAPPEAIWPFVANTDRLNKAIGMAPVVFTDSPLPGGGALRTGENRVLGLAIRWREYPFEWVRNREHSVFRWFRSGPVSALWNKVKLERTASGGTLLTNELWLVPRGVLGSLAVFLEIERKLQPAFQRFYEHLDETLAKHTALDPFEPPHVPTDEQRAVIRTGCEELGRAGVSSTIVERLAMHLSTAPDALLESMRPFALADAWGHDRGEVLDAFVHAANVGLVAPSWDIVCPRCQLAHETQPELGKVRSVGTCAACATTFERDLREHVELVFVPNARIRRIERATYCAGAPALRPHVLLQQVLDPGEERRVTVDLPRGTYRITGALAREPMDVMASAVGFETTCEVASDGTRTVGGPAIVRAGEVTFVLRNDGDREETLRLETSTGRTDGVSGLTAITHPSFRALFPDELLAHGEHVRVRRMAFLFLQLDPTAKLHRELGDAAACEELTNVEALVAREALAEEGTLVTSSLDMLVVAFTTPVRAIRAALAIRTALEQRAAGAHAFLAAHEGTCVALTRDQRPDFFGETLVRGRDLLADCPLRGIVLSASFASDRDVALAVHETNFREAVVTSESGPYAGRRITKLSPK